VAPEVSTVVPTRDRPESLARCLAALEHQTLASVLELVVVDDGSEQERAVAEVVASVPSARLVRIPRGGVAAARNAGVRAAGGRFVCITDDDCVPDLRWAERMRETFATGADAAAGPTVNGRLDDPLAGATQTIVEFLTERSLGPASSTRFAPGSNIAATAETLAAVPFDETYGPGGEDRDWCARVLASGRRIAWQPGAVVAHHQELTLQAFLRKHVNWGRGARQFRRAQPSASAMPGPGFYAALLRRGFEQGTATGLLVLLAQLATAVGYADEALGATPGETNGRVRRSGGG